MTNLDYLGFMVLIASITGPLFWIIMVLFNNEE